MDSCDLNSLVLSTDESLHESDSDIMEKLQSLFHKVDDNSWTLQNDEHNNWESEYCDEANAYYVQASEYDIGMCTDPQPEVDEANAFYVQASEYDKGMCTDPQPEVDEITLGATAHNFVDEEALGIASERYLDEITLGATSDNFVNEELAIVYETTLDEITLGATSDNFVDEELAIVPETTQDDTTLGATPYNFVNEVDMGIMSEMTLVDTTLAPTSQNFVDEVVDGVSEIKLYDTNLGASSKDIENEADLGLLSEINLDDITLDATSQNIVDEENSGDLSEINLPDVSLGAFSQTVVDELILDTVNDTNQDDENIGALPQLCDEEMLKFIDDLDLAEVQSVPLEDFNLLGLLSEDDLDLAEVQSDQLEDFNLLSEDEEEKKEEAKKEEICIPGEQGGPQILVDYYDTDEEWKSEYRRNFFDHLDLGYMRKSTVKRKKVKNVFLFDPIDLELEQELEKPEEEFNRVPTDLISWDSESLSEHEFEKIIQSEIELSPCARDSQKRKAEIGSRYGSMAKKQKLDTEEIKRIISIMHDYAMKPPSQAAPPSQDKPSTSDAGENTHSSTSAIKTYPESRSTSSPALSTSSELPSTSCSSKSNTSVPQKVSAKQICTELAASTSIHDMKKPEFVTAPARKRGRPPLTANKRGRPRKYPITEGVNKVPASSSCSLTTANPAPGTSSDNGATDSCPPPKYYTKQNWLNEMERQRRQKIADLYAALKVHVPSVANKDYTPRQQILDKTIDYISELKKLDERQMDEIQSLKRMQRKLKKMKADQEEQLLT